MELFSPQARARLSLKRWWWQSKVDWDEDDVYDVNQDVDKDEDEVDNDREKMFVDKDDEDVWHEVYDDGDCQRCYCFTLRMGAGLLISLAELSTSENFNEDFDWNGKAGRCIGLFQII